MNTRVQGAPQAVTQLKEPKRDGKTRQKLEESIRIYKNKNLPRVPDENGSSNS